MKKQINLGFVDFSINWGPFPNPANYFCGLLKDDYDIRVVKSDFCGYIVDTGVAPDFVICAVPGDKHKSYTCPKIYFPGEPYSLNLDSYQWALTYHFSEDSRQHRLPLYPLYGDVDRLTKSRPPVGGREFCCVLFGKPYPFEETPREYFFDKLCKYKKVHSAGRHLNNVGFIMPPSRKAEYIKNFKFVLSFESCSLPGFTTEKIFEPLLENTVPVYWGNTQIGLDFNTKRFVNACEYDSLDEIIERVIYLDQSEEAYKEVLEQPCFEGNIVNEYVRKENLIEFFRGIFG